MEPKQEKWINDTLNSLDGMRQAEPSPFLFAKIRNRLATSPSVAYVPMRTVWLAIASFTLLLLLNLQIISQPSRSNSLQTNELNTVVSDMHLFPASNQLYDNLWSEQNY